MAKFCTTCGTSLKEDDIFCPECGAKINSEAPKVEEKVEPEEVEEPVHEEVKPAEHHTVENNQEDLFSVKIETKNTVGLVGFILSFVVPIAGLICSIIGLQKAKELNDDSKNLCIAGIIISAVLTVVSIILIIVWIANSGGSSVPNYYDYY